MKILRRLFSLVLSLVLLAAAGLAAVFFVAFAPVSTVGEVGLEHELAIPPLAESHVTDDGTRVFELTAQEGTTALLPGKPTETWGFNGSYLGPTLRAARGEQVRVNVHNELDETTTVHWHGMHLPARYDGGPHQPVGPGATWSPQWRIDQPAATLWYHPHPHGQTEEHVNRGLAGMFILDDPRRAVADRLPHEYGVDDIPVIVQDKRFGGNGVLRNGGLGEDLLVNGTYGPYLDVTTEKVRLRLLNASVKRVYSFGFSDDRDFTMIGTGGGLMHLPVAMDRLRLSPGERAEVVVDMRPGEDAVLRSYPPDLGGNGFTDRFNGGADEFDVLELRAADRLRASPRLPAELAPAPDLDTTDAHLRTFELSGRQINDKSMDMARVDETVELGSTEIWQVTNTAGEYHNFHVHDVQFEVLSVDGHDPGAELGGWKDTIFLPPGTTARVALHFADYADPDLPYMYHCHLLQHEDSGMMGQFVVVEPGH
ncbi:MAG TPA: multicopper oxidase domain-containing protein [Nocardioidaceae bacterium]|nr:multicopper oxidase domain-containing protein [Nocardioidaceae bacterium]